MILTRKGHISSSLAFTLIELLIVVAIIAILAVVVVLTLNPAQLLAQSRDASRVSDMSTLNSAIALYQTDLSGSPSFSLGTTSSTYLSIPDTTSTCATIGFPSGNTCVNTTSSRNIDGTGWLPIAFKNISTGAPFSSLPIDPTNTSSSGLYYTYTTTGTTYQLIAGMESQKYEQSITGPLGNGIDVQGSNTGQGPVGWWKLDEGTGSSTIDSSGNNNTGTWAGTAAGTNGTYYVTGKVGSYAGKFDGSTDKLTISSGVNLSSSLSCSAWVNANASSGIITILSFSGVNDLCRLWYVGSSATFEASYKDSSNAFHAVIQASSTYVPGQWAFLVSTYTNGVFSLYVNGVLVISASQTAPPAWGTVSGSVGWYSTPTFSGLIDDVRVYNRGLGVGEVQALYNAGR